MTEMLHNGRTPEVDVDSMFYDRWSPRAFREDPVPGHQLQSLFEAARWAPSCYNEQPWLFVYATNGEDRKRFLSALMARNQSWAVRAPVLMFLFCRRVFEKTGKTNRHAPFDAGAAWMSLALQARRIGLYAHAMAGFIREKAYEVTGVPEDDYDVYAAIAVGRRGDGAKLPKDLADVEFPNERKSLRYVACEGYFPSV